MGRRARGVCKDGTTNRSSSTDCLSVHVSFTLFWLVVDVRRRNDVKKVFAANARRWPAASKKKLPSALKIAIAKRIAKCRRNCDHKELMKTCCRSVNDRDDGQALVLPRSVTSGGKSAGDDQWSVAVRRYLENWTESFFKCRLVFDGRFGAGLHSRVDIGKGTIIARGLRDSNAPETDISCDVNGCPVLGPLALVNCGCSCCVNARIDNEYKLVSTKRIIAGTMILTRYDPPEGVRWTCPGCKTRTIRVSK